MISFYRAYLYGFGTQPGLTLRSTRTPYMPLRGIPCAG